MKVRSHEVFLGCFLTVAVFAVGMLFASSYQPSPAAKNPSQQSETAAQNRDASKPFLADHARDGQTTQHKEEKSEFWSAKLTDWLLAAFTALLVAASRRQEHESFPSHTFTPHPEEPRSCAASRRMAPGACG
jgi:hypothetical protein